jgi:competence protein ComEA
MRRIDLARGSPSPRKYTSYVAVVVVAATAFVAAMVLIPILRPAPRIAPPAQPSERTSEAPAVLVHVAGAVRRPGLYELDEGDRVADAIEAAGGPRRGADLDVLNLAQVVVDGSRIEVPVKGVAPGVQPTTPAGTAPMVSLNSATQAELETIPGVGPVTAQAILTHRLEVGGFTALEQLLDVDGIGPATFESLSAYVTL